MKTITLTFASFALLSAGFSTGFLDPAAAVAGDRHQKSSTRTAPAHQAGAEMPAAGQANRQPNRHFPPNYYLNRPLGSATNTPRGYYRDQLSYDPPPQGEPGSERTVYVPQPVYYVVPPLFPEDGEPLSFGDVRGPDQAVDPDQLGAASSRPVVIEADNIYVVPPDDPRLDRTPRHAADDYRARAPAAPIERPVGNYGNVPTQALDPAPAEPAQPEDPHLVSLSIQPADAVVWLDDEELGLAGELAGSVVLEPGVYLLEVEHDELDDQRLFFGVVDQGVDVRVDLTADVPRRRYRVR